LEILKKENAMSDRQGEVDMECASLGRGSSGSLSTSRVNTITEPERIQHLNNAGIQNGDYVLYWMQQSQRAEENHALEYAVRQANEVKRPLLVVFGLMDDYPGANLRHFSFLLEGLQETERKLHKRKIPLIVQRGQPADVALSYSKNACLMVCDRGYLRHQKQWRNKVAENSKCGVVEIESDVIVPVRTASSKQEFAARTIRPKIHSQLKYFLRPFKTVALKYSSLKFTGGLDLSNIDAVLRRMKIDHSIGPVTRFYRGGTSEAKKRLAEFLTNRLQHYRADRDQPQTESTSHLSMYLHFGQISALYIALEASKIKNHGEDRDAFLEQLIVRRELAMNFVEFTQKYDAFDALPEWVRRTLKDHQNDRREHVYTRKQLEDAATHDPFWNTAMNEAKITGYMHNYMRMYWSKKILEWSKSPEIAWKVTIEIMNRYLLDARDANAYANVSGSFGLHDRPWGERPIFGKVRYMSSSSLARKADMDAYIRKIDALRSI
jgi:deoxyribodipyrimidine photo-lyase